MKILLTGSTGFIGSEVLSQCLAHPAITSIIALSRRPLPESITKEKDTSKLKTVIVEDFTKWEDDVLRDCEGAEACIW
jgi:uncharacterized protein YbjT (DUF2867 family)